MAMRWGGAVTAACHCVTPKYDAPVMATFPLDHDCFAAHSTAPGAAPPAAMGRAAALRTPGWTIEGNATSKCWSFFALSAGARASDPIAGSDRRPPPLIASVERRRPETVHR